MLKQKIGFLGCGNMAAAIIGGIISGGVVPADQIYAYALHYDALKARADAQGYHAVDSLDALCRSSDVIVLAVKPNVVPQVLAEAGEGLAGKTVISIAAGLSVERLTSMLPGQCHLLRVMPNTPAMVGAGATALCSSTNFTEDEKAVAEQIFGAIGIFEWVPERLMDAVTAVSCSGPAYVFLFIEAMADAGVREGLPRATAYRLAAQTVLGSGKMMIDTGKHPGLLKDMVCSPAGTTIEAVYALEKGGLRAAVQDAVRVCADKSKLMGK